VSALPNVFDNYEVPFDKWNHLDYLYGVDAFTLVYPQVLSNMARAESLYQEELRNAQNNQQE
jgi:hypothetical protein